LCPTLSEAPDEIRHLRDLLPVDDEPWLESVKGEGYSIVECGKPRTLFRTIS